MTSSIKIRIGIIIAVILVCLYGVIGIPKSKDELLANWKKNIHLGLDLSGGTQLVMQVQLQDAFKAAADNAMADRRRAVNMIARKFFMSANENIIRGKSQCKKPFGAHLFAAQGPAARARIRNQRKFLRAHGDGLMF